MQQQPDSPGRAGAGKEGGGGGGGSHPIALEGIHGAPLCTGLKKGWGEEARGRGCESLCRRRRRGALGRGQAPAGTYWVSFPAEDAGVFGGVCSRRHARLSYEQRRRRRQHMAGVRQHPEPLQRRGRGRAGDPPGPRRLRGTGHPASQGTPAPLPVPALSALWTGMDTWRQGKGWCGRAERWGQAAGRGQEGWEGGCRPLGAPLSSRGASGKWRTLGFTSCSYQALAAFRVCILPPLPPTPGFPSNPNQAGNTGKVSSSSYNTCPLSSGSSPPLARKTKP